MKVVEKEQEELKGIRNTGKAPPSIARPPTAR
jgi:hypothetical protein